MPSARQLILGGGLALVALAAAVYASVSGQRTPSTPAATTLMTGWEGRFKLEWSVESEAGGTRRIRGYITSQHGEYAEPVRLLAQALDASGAVVGRRIAWVPGGVNGFQRAYFEIPDLPSAQGYRVSVWDYTFLQS